MNLFFFSEIVTLCLALWATRMQEKSLTASVRIGYDLSAPDKTLPLPPALLEISGITNIDASLIACVQDEHGIVFIYDVVKNQIIKQIFFGSEGDYEDIARAGGTLYILRSDEVLAEIMNFNSSKFKRSSFQASIPGHDCEGLCYDQKNNRLLIVPKEIPADNPDYKGKRFIYGFDLATKRVIKGPVIIFDIASIKRFAVENSIKVPMKGKKGEKQEPDIELRISGIAIHPATSRIYAISGQERMLYVFDGNGKIEFLERLDRDLYPQPEGITFMPDGDLLISNEGREGTPTLVRLNYSVKKP